MESNVINSKEVCEDERQCGICGKKFDTINGLSKHVAKFHRNIPKEEYYQKYINKISSICYCGKKKKFRGFGEGYREYCSHVCSCGSEKTKEKLRIKNIGKKQSKETILKRISNIDQRKKEQTRKNTMIERYGVTNCGEIPEIVKRISETNKGRKNPRIGNQQEKIIESKRRNGTLKHSMETRLKIRDSLIKVYQSDNPPVTISENNNIRHVSGHLNGIYYRSSYELKFLKYCFENNIKVESAETKRFRAPYMFEGKSKMYYPDFYLEDYDVVIEIKPLSRLSEDLNQEKIHSMLSHNKFSYVVVTEEELDELDYFFKYL